MHMCEITSSPRLPRYWLERLYFACTTVANGWVTWTEPESYLAQIANRSGREGWFVIGALIAAGAVAIADVLINDFLPCRFTFPWAKRWRHLVFMPMAIGLVALCYVIAEPEQFTVMADSKQLIQDTAGRYASQLGQRPAGVTSGVANNILVEQGEQSMGEMNDNYTTGRRLTFEAVVDLISEDHREAGMRVPIGVGKSRRVVVLNAWDGEGMPVNQVADAEIKTALADTPNTPAYRQQTQNQVTQIISALGNNPAAVAVLAPAYIESTTLPNRQQVADDLRKASGQPIAGDKEGRAKAEADQQAAQQQQVQQAQQQAAAVTDEKVASAERFRAQARQANANADLVESRIAAGAGPAEVAQTMAQVQASQAPAANEDQIISEALEGAQTAA